VVLQPPFPGPNIVINTIVAEALDEIATRLEKSGKSGLNKEATAIVRDAVKKHGRVIFNGTIFRRMGCRSQEARSAEHQDRHDALATMATPQAEKLFDKYQVLSPKELHSRYEIYLGLNVKHVNIEAQASVQMVKRLFIPAGMKFAAELAGASGP